MKKSKAAKVLISIAMAFSLALNVFASNGSPLLETKPESEQTKSSTASPIVEEDFTKRGEYEKHFICEDGSYIAATYPYAVHEKDENGEWIDIDNSLALEDNRIENQSATNRVSFATKAANTGRIAKLEKNGHALEWSLSGTIVKPTAQKAAADFVGPLPAFCAEETALSEESRAAIEPEEAAAKPLTVEEANAEKLRLRKLTSSVLYEDAMGEGIDVRYTVIPGKVKEDVILKQPSGFRGYTMHVNTRSLTAVKLEDNSVEFRNENDEVCFVIATPYMYDAAGAESFAIDVEVTRDEANCTITFTPDAAWLNAADRVYPVTIDPTTFGPDDPHNNQYDGANYDDTYVHVDDNVSGSNGTCTACGVRHNKQDRMYVGIRKVGSVYKKHRSFFRIKDMPALTPGSTINEAQLTVWYTDKTSTGREIGLYKNLGGWNNDNLTWNNQPSWYKLESHPYNSAGIQQFNKADFLTGIRMMYSGEANNGFMLCYESESLSNPDFNAFYTSNSAVVKRPERPLLELKYQTPANIADGVYFIRSKSSGKYMDVAGAGGAGTRAIQYSFGGGTSQQWRVTKQTDGYYKLQPLHKSGLSLEVKGGVVTNGTTVQANTDSNIAAQRWAFFSCPGGGYRIMPKVGNQAMCLNVTGASQADWANVILYDYTGDDNCVWEMEKAEQPVAKIRIFATNDGGSSSLDISGHAFISIENIVGFSYPIGAINLNSGHEMTLGTWSGMGWNGMWYNLETTDNTPVYVYLTDEIQMDEIYKLNQYIASHNSWSPTKNCSYFATGLWNEISSTKLSAGTPNTPTSLKQNILKVSGNETGRKLSKITPIGYVGSDGKFVNKNDVSLT